MKRKIISLLLCLVMALSLIPTVAFGYSKADAENQYERVNSFDHIDVRVDATFTYETMTDGALTDTVTKTATISNPKITLYDKDGKQKGEKSFSDFTKYEWRWTKIEVLKTDKIVVTCDITVDDQTMRGKTFTFEGKDDFVQAILNCDRHQGLDFNISGSDVLNILSEGKLTIVKNLNQAFDTAQTFTFNVTKAGDENFADTIEVTVPAGAKTAQVATDAKYAYGTYTVTEANATIDGYDWTAPAAQSFTIDATHLYESLTFTNTYEKLPTASETIDIPVEKVWSDGNENHDNDSVTVKLLKNDEETEYTLTLNKTNNWQGSFKNVPAGGSYTVSEDPVSGYTASYTQPVITGLSVSNWGAKVTPASTPSHGVTGNLLVAKKGGNYFVWTSDTLNETQQNDLMVAINKANLVGLGKALTARNTVFASGEPASFNADDVTINNGTITFKEPNVWSLFYCGNLTLSSVTKAIITNTPVAPKTVTVEIPVTKTVSAKVGSTLPKNLPSFTFKAYLGEKEVGTLTLALNEKTKVSGAQNQYQGTLTANIPAASLADGSVVLTIKEVKGTASYWTYDKNFYTVDVFSNVDAITMSIKLNGKGDPLNEGITFENTYSNKYTPTPKPTTPAKPVTSVKTGDMGVALYAGLAILSMTGSAGVILRRRKNDK